MIIQNQVTLKVNHSKMAFGTKYDNCVQLESAISHD